MNGRRGVVLAVAGALAVMLGLIVWASMGLAQVTGEICFTFNGREECRRASGTTQAEAIRTAAEMACSVLASGMAQRIDCVASQPSRATWE